MEKLIDAVFVKLAKSNPAAPLTTEHKNRIEQCIHQLIPDFHTPSHPPYASMIHRAIMELNEQKGSSEDSISTFIKKEYDDLPWAHASYLRLHLDKLMQKGEIYVTRNKCYKMNLNPKVRGQKRKRGRGRHGKETWVEEESRSHEQKSTVNEENRPQNKKIILRIVRQQKGETEASKDQSQSKWLQIEMIEEHKQSHDRHDEMVEEKTQQRGEIEVFEEQNRPMGPQSELIEVQNQSCQQHDAMIIEKNQGEEKHTELNEEQDDSQGQPSFVSSKHEQAEEHHIVVFDERSRAEEKIKVKEGLDELGDPKSQVSNETELVGKQRRETRSSSHNDDHGVGGDGDRVGSMVQFGEPLEPLNEVNEEQFPPQGENIRVRTEILRPHDDSKGGISYGNGMKAPADVTANPMLEEDKKKKLEEGKQLYMKILSEGKMDVVCALQAEKKHQQEAKKCKQVKPSPLLPASMTTSGDRELLLNPKRLPDLEITSLQNSSRKHRKRAKHCDVLVSESQNTITETPLNLVVNSVLCRQPYQLRSRSSGGPIEAKLTELEELSKEQEQQPIDLELTAVEHSSQIQQERQQPRTLRNQGDKMSDPKPARDTFVVENFPIQHERQLFLPPNLEWSMEIKPTSMEETSQITEQQPKTRRQRKQFTSRPLDLSLDPQQSGLPLLLEFSGQVRPLELERNKVEKSFGTVPQQRQENLQRRKLQPRDQVPPEIEPATETVMEQSLPSQQGRGRGRPPKLIKATVAIIAELLPSQQKEYHHGTKQNPGRPLKAKPDAGTTKGDVLQRTERKRRGRPPKYKPDEKILL